MRVLARSILIFTLSLAATGCGDGSATGGPPSGSGGGGESSSTGSGGGDAPGEFVSCKGSTAVWTLFGAADDHFTWQDYPGQFGDECRDFWLAERSCAGVDDAIDLGIGAPGECVEYTGCSSPVRYCLYGPATGHQRPDYYPAETMEFFRSF
jgi:hypothetical protein